MRCTVLQAGQEEGDSAAADSDGGASSSSSDNVDGFLERESYMPGKAAAQQQQASCSPSAAGLLACDMLPTS